MTPLDHALAYARLGWRVAPIPPGFKYPHGIDDWQARATIDEARIVRYWEQNPTHGLCIVTGVASGLVAIDIDPRHGGDEGWTDLEQKYGPAPETVESITGGGGRHLLFRMPAGVTITNAGAYHLPPGIDVRGEGGQIVAPPTIHPETCRPYLWEVAHDPLDGFPTADPGPWLQELLTRGIPDQTARRDAPLYAGGDSIIELFAAHHTWPDLLGHDGWTFHSKRCEYGTGELYEMWTRPGKQAREGASATLYYRGSDVLKVHTSAARPLVATETYTRFGYWATMNHGGDMVAAARAARRELGGAQNRESRNEEHGSPSDEKAKPTSPQVTASEVKHESQSARTAIVHNGRHLDELTAQAIAAIHDANDPPVLFVRAGYPARLREDEEQRPIIESLRPEHMRLQLSQAAQWYRVNKDGERTPTSPPLDVSSSVLAAGSWPLPPLAGVVELPVLRPDGTFATEHGYDAATRLYHWHRGAPYAPIDDHPTPEQLTAAVDLMDELLADFPWDTTADRANAWALLLTPLVRAVVGQVPMALIDAPEPGTGKGLLVKLAAIITIGRAAGLMAWPASEEELEKKVTAAMMAGSTMLIFDNVEGIIKSATLAAVLTADTWQGRVLGLSQLVNVSNRATWAATGNNIDVGGDLARRCYRIRLDARRAQPWKRTDFVHPDLEHWAAGNRGRLLHALCTMVRSWWVAGRPLASQIAAMGGYTGWVRTVGGILEHAGVPGFLANLDQFHADADRDAQTWEAFLCQWSDAVGEQPLTVGDLIVKMGETYTGQAWRDVLPDELSGYWDTPSFSRRLGHALRKRTGRHYGSDGMHLVEMPRDRRQVAVYAVTQRSMSLLPIEEGRGMCEIPREDDSLTCDDATERGIAGSMTVPRDEKSYPQAENLLAGTPQHPADPHIPRLAEKDMF